MKNIETKTLEFQDYEIERIKEGLKLLIEKSGRKWELQETGGICGGYGYTDSKESKRLKFILRSIDRQTKI